MSITPWPCPWVQDVGPRLNRCVPARQRCHAPVRHRHQPYSSQATTRNAHIRCSGKPQRHRTTTVSSNAICVTKRGVSPHTTVMHVALTGTWTVCPLNFRTQAQRLLHTLSLHPTRACTPGHGLSRCAPFLFVAVPTFVTCVHLCFLCEHRSRPSNMLQSLWGHLIYRRKPK